MTKPSWQDYGTYDESAYPQLWDGVVAAWCPSLGPTGERLHDLSRANNWSTLTNMDPATDWVVSGGHYALDFDGADDYAISVANVDITGAQPRTIASWIDLKSSANSALFGYGEAADNKWFYLSIISGAWYISGFNNDVATAVSPQLGLQHVALSYSGATVTLFVDGVNIAAAAKSYNTTAGPVNIARRNFSSPLHATVSLNEIAVWRRALTPNEIQQLYLLGRGGMYERRRRTARRAAIEQAAFRAYWARRQNQIIGGGVQ